MKPLESDSEHRKPWSPPIFRWAGSKRKLVPILLKHCPSNYGRYIEPFAGSACLFFALKPKKAILGDINEELLRAYNTIRNHPKMVARAAKVIPNSKEMYYKTRNTDPDMLNPVDRAARFVYLNRFCFNGVYRVNKRGQFNVPRGYRTGQIQDESMFYHYSLLLRAVEFHIGDFEKCLQDTQKNDFLYLDPPYATNGRRRAGEYGNNCFESKDIIRLVKILKQIDKIGARFLLSYANTSELANLLPSWTCNKLLIRRHVAGFAKHRVTVKEVIISNF